MEIKAKLNKPFKEEQRLDFIVKYNHNLGYKIEENNNGLEAWGLSDDEKGQKERERINMLSLTAADVERALYKSKGIDFDDIIELVKDNPDVDLKALKIELKANNFYRGNPWINQIALLLGYTSDELDYLFLNKELPQKQEPEPTETKKQATTEEISEVVEEKG